MRLLKKTKDVCKIENKKSERNHMAEFLFRKLFALFLLVSSFVLFSVGVLAAVHPLYSGFSSANSGFVFNNASGLVSVSDTAVYKIGHYSINGGAWQSFTLAGTSYNGDVNWLSGSSSRMIPVFGVGEHYIIVYSCFYNVSNVSWDCNDNKWQLIIVNNTNNVTVPPVSCNDTCSSLGFQCGIQTVCSNSTSCGTCSIGYSCNATGRCVLNCTTHNSSSCYNGDVYWYNSCGAIEGIRYDCNSSQTCSSGACVNIPTGTCGGQTCTTGEYCSNNACLLTVSGHTYFVATNGNDNNPGNFTHPWKTWQKAVTMAYPGDITYIRGGVYSPTAHISTNGRSSALMAIRPLSNDGRSGTAGNPIRYFNYPGEKPILDGSLLGTSVDRYNIGINVEYGEYIHFRGLTVRNIRQTNPADENGQDWAFGFGAVPAANLIFENCVAHDIMGRGFYFESGAWNEWDTEYAVQICLEQQAARPDGGNPAICVYNPTIFTSDTTYFINCDAYNLFDALSASPGNSADGWKCGNYYGGTMYFIGCRAFNYSDDGFDPGGAGRKVFDGCWAVPTDKYRNIPNSWAIETNGFKTGGIGQDQFGHVPYDYNFVYAKNCIVADCGPGLGGGGTGFSNNLETSYYNSAQTNAKYFNNFIYSCRTGFADVYNPAIHGNPPRTSEFRNNIVYDSYSPEYEQIQLYRPSIYPNSDNTWISTNLVGEESWPGWEYNPAFTVTDDDFVSLDTSQLMRPRKADGSLPDITFGHLKAGSDLIDGGTNVGLPYSGSAPDLGPFESNY